MYGKLKTENGKRVLESKNIERWERLCKLIRIRLIKKDNQHTKDKVK